MKSPSKYMGGHRAWIRWAAWACAVPCLVACSEEAPTHSPRADVQVRLPKSPSLESVPPAPRFPDGALSVEAALRDADRNVGREITVRGLVADTVPCETVKEPAPRSKKSKGKTKKRAPAEEECHPPSHLYLADDVSSQRYRLLVVGWSPNKVRGVRAGQQLTFRGKFERVSPGGTFIRQAGLLVVDP